VGLNNYHLVCGAGMGLPSLEMISEWFDTRVETAYKSLMTGTASYYGVKAQKIFPLPRSVGVVAATRVGPGTDGMDGLPGQVSGLIGFRTNLAGKDQRGRVYIPFPDENSNDDPTNAPDAGYLIALQALADLVKGSFTIVDGGNEITVTFVIYHRDTDEYSVVTEAVARAGWGTQRSRGSYGSKNAYPPF